MYPSIFSGVLFAAAVSAQCSREYLTDVTDAFIKAQSSGTIAAFLSTFGADPTYTENQNALDIQLGILGKPLKIDHSRSIHDYALCGAFTEIISTNPDHPFVIGTRILLDGSLVTLMESVVTKPGDWAFNATGYLHWNSLENWDPIPADKQDSREVIQAAANAYFDRFNDVNAVVPFGTPCARLEGGAYTGEHNLTAETCSLGLPSTVTVTDRRYVVDETLGAVSVFLGFPGLDRSQGQAPMPDGHLFRVEGGKIRYIHTVSSCVTAGCGMNSTTPPSLL